MTLVNALQNYSTHNRYTTSHYSNQVEIAPDPTTIRPDR